MLYFYIVSNKLKDSILKVDDTTSNSSLTKLEILLKDNPQLKDPRYFLEYYKIDTILNSKQSEQELVFADKKPLPNVIL